MLSIYLKHTLFLHLSLCLAPIYINNCCLWVWFRQLSIAQVLKTRLLVSTECISKFALKVVKWLVIYVPIVTTFKMSCIKYNLQIKSSLPESSIHTVLWTFFGSTLLCVIQCKNYNDFVCSIVALYKCGSKRSQTENNNNLLST